LAEFSDFPPALRNGAEAYYRVSTQVEHIGVSELSEILEGGLHYTGEEPSSAVPGRDYRIARTEGVKDR
jgi:hypothetical protein